MSVALDVCSQSYVQEPYAKRRMKTTDGCLLQKRGSYCLPAFSRAIPLRNLCFRMVLPRNLNSQLYSCDTRALCGATTQPSPWQLQSGRKYSALCPVQCCRMLRIIVTGVAWAWSQMRAWHGQRLRHSHKKKQSSETFSGVGGGIRVILVAGKWAAIRI